LTSTLSTTSESCSLYHLRDLLSLPPPSLSLSTTSESCSLYHLRVFLSLPPPSLALSTTSESFSLPRVFQSLPSLSLSSLSRMSVLSSVELRAFVSCVACTCLGRGQRVVQRALPRNGVTDIPPPHVLSASIVCASILRASGHLPCICCVHLWCPLR